MSNKIHVIVQVRIHVYDGDPGDDRDKKHLIWEAEASGTAKDGHAEEARKLAEQMLDTFEPGAAHEWNDDVGDWLGL